MTIKDADADLTDEQRELCYKAWTVYRDELEALGDYCADISSFRAGFMTGWKQKDEKRKSGSIGI